MSKAHPSEPQVTKLWKKLLYTGIAGCVLAFLGQLITLFKLYGLVTKCLPDQACSATTSDGQVSPLVFAARMGTVFGIVGVLLIISSVVVLLRDENKKH